MSAVRREVGAGNDLEQLAEQLLRPGVRVLERPGNTPGHFAKVVRWDAGGHADRDALRAVDEQVRDAGGQDDRLDRVPGVVRDEVDGLLVDVPQHLHGERLQPAFGVAVRRRRVIAGRAEVALWIDQRVAQRPRLGHPHERVVERRVAVRVVVAHHVADHAAALDEVAVGAEARVVHPVEDLAVHRLEAVANVGQRSPDDDRHGVVDVAALHLRLDVDRLDPVAAGDIGGVSHGLLRCPRTGRLWRCG